MLSNQEIAPLVTMNKELLAKLPLEAVLQFHPLIDAQTLKYGVCQKTRDIRARPACTVIGAPDLTSRLLLKTLEANEGIKPDAFICEGEGGDVWCQAGPKLHAKYDPIAVDSDGWTTFRPKADVPFNCHQVQAGAIALGPANGFSIFNGADGDGWGDSRVLDPSAMKIFDELGVTPPPAKKGKYHLHYGLANDWILQNPKDQPDTYRVAVGFFKATYEVTTPPPT